MPTTAGSFVLAKEKPSINSALADKLTDAGMIIIAKANLTVSVLLLHCNVWILTDKCKEFCGLKYVENLSTEASLTSLGRVE
jgi:hypothetical protein